VTSELLAPGALRRPTGPGDATFHSWASEPLDDLFGDLMNAPAKYVVSKTLETPIWRNTTVIRDDVVGVVRKLKAKPYPTGVVGLHYRRQA
jgi:hypothetical protein